MSSDSTIPSWVFDPKKKILTIVYGAFIGGLGAALGAFVTSFRTASRSVRTAILDAGLAIETSFASAGTELLELQFALQSVFESVGTGGLAAPISVAVVTVVAIGFTVLVLGALVSLLRLVLPV